MSECRLRAALAALLLLPGLLAPPAPAAENGLTALSEKLEKGGLVAAGALVVAARSFKDGSAQLDACSGGRVERVSIDPEGRVERSPAGRLSEATLEEVRVCATDAARAAVRRLGEKELRVRAVVLETREPRAEYLAYAYDEGGEFAGTCRIDPSDGSWAGWDEGVGERDPLGGR